MDTYFDILPKDLTIMIASKVESLMDMTNIKDIFKLERLDYLILCKIYYPELFPIKFVYGDTIEKYNWMLLYLNFLNKCHTYDIIKAYMIYNKRGDKPSAGPRKLCQWTTAKEPQMRAAIYPTGAYHRERQPDSRDSK